MRSNARQLPARALALGAALLLGWSASASAHRLAPSYLQLEEGPQDGAGVVQVLWKTPRLRAAGAPLRPVLPRHCTPLSEPRVQDEPAARIERWVVDCGPKGLVGETLSATGLDESGTDVVLHVTLADGRVVRGLLSASEPALHVPARERPEDVVRSYGRLGMKHLLGGFDHVLFVTGIALLLRGRRLLAAVTGFTAGHSVTLTMAALGIVSLPSGLVEVGIAASLVVLGIELAAPTGARLFSRAPLRAAAGFGLLHGLGFAAALAQLGLPSTAIPLALFSFNAGLEVGQLLLLAAWLPALAILDRAGSHWPRLTVQAPATVIGSLGVFFLLDRAFRLLWW